MAPLVDLDSVVVFSTYVEVILLTLSLRLMPFSILHVCGGDPFVQILGHRMKGYSPRMWR